MCVDNHPVGFSAPVLRLYFLLPAYLRRYSPGTAWVSLWLLGELTNMYNLSSDDWLHALIHVSNRLSRHADRNAPLLYSRIIRPILPHPNSVRQPICNLVLEYAVGVTRASQGVPHLEFSMAPLGRCLILICRSVMEGVSNRVSQRFHVYFLLLAEDRIVVCLVLILSDHSTSLRGHNIEVVLVYKAPDIRRRVYLADDLSWVRVAVLVMHHIAKVTTYLWVERLDKVEPLGKWLRKLP